MRGLTLVEVLVVIGIIALLASFVVSPFASFRDREILRVTTGDALSALAKARTQTLIGLGDSAYGVHFQSDRATIFTGETYQAGSASNENIIFSPLVVASTINLSGGGTDVVFRRLSGAASVGGTITFSLVSSSTQTKVVTVATSGIAYAN